MSIDVVLEDADGNFLEHLDDHYDVLRSLLPHEDDNSYPMASCIQEYGFTVFNQCQAERLVPELDRLMAKTSDAASLTYMAAIKEFAIKCRDRPAIYLRFVGD